MPKAKLKTRDPMNAIIILNAGIRRKTLHPKTRPAVKAYSILEPKNNWAPSSGGIGNKLYMANIMLMSTAFCTNPSGRNTIRRKIDAKAIFAIGPTAAIAAIAK